MTCTWPHAQEVREGTQKTNLHAKAPRTIHSEKAPIANKGCAAALAAFQVGGEGLHELSHAIYTMHHSGTAKSGKQCADGVVVIATSLFSELPDSIPECCKKSSFDKATAVAKNLIGLATVQRVAVVCAMANLGRAAKN